MSQCNHNECIDSYKCEKCCRCGEALNTKITSEDRIKNVTNFLSEQEAFGFQTGAKYGISLGWKEVIDFFISIGFNPELETVTLIKDEAKRRGYINETDGS